LRGTGCFLPCPPQCFLINRFYDYSNAGGFPAGVSKENILTVNSRPRSKRLAEVLQKTGFIERSGQGVDKMFYRDVVASDAGQLRHRVKGDVGLEENLSYQADSSV